MASQVYRNTLRVILVLFIASGFSGDLFAKDKYEAARRKMVEEYVIAGGVTNQRVIESMLRTQRHEFVPAKHHKDAYFDTAIAIGSGQTISSPFIVAYMTESLEPQPTDRVLEIGTGSGYQAAVLSPLVKDVYTIEIVKELGENATNVLEKLKYENVHTRVGDGFLGWPEAAPFDKIIVTCSPEKVPQPLIDQLNEGGMMVIPVGERYQQSLYLFRKTNGKLESIALRPTLFVPMTGQAEAMREVQPDPTNPSIVNGNFETPPDSSKSISGWYYASQAEYVTDEKAPDGEHYVKFKNENVGRSSHLLQGIGIDGSKVTHIEMSATIKTDLVLPGLEKSEMPMFAISFYDAQRRDLGVVILGPFTGTADWHKESKIVKVPPQAREGVVRIGLFGATGTALFDKVEIKSVPDPKKK